MVLSNQSNSDSDSITLHLIENVGRSQVDRK